MTSDLMLWISLGAPADFADAGLGEVAWGVGLGGSIAVPLGLSGGILGVGIGAERESWFGRLAGYLGRLPSLLSAILLGMVAVALGCPESPTMWGGVATLAGVPVIWRLVMRSLAELPSGIAESAAALGLTRWQTLWVTGFPLVGPTLAGAVGVGVARAMTVGWVVSQLRSSAGEITMQHWLQLAGWVAPVTVAGTWLLAEGRRRSRALERAAA